MVWFSADAKSIAGFLERRCRRFWSWVWELLPSGCGFLFSHYWTGIYKNTSVSLCGVRIGSRHPSFTLKSRLFEPARSQPAHQEDLGPPLAHATLCSPTLSPPLSPPSYLYPLVSSLIKTPRPPTPQLPVKFSSWLGRRLGGNPSKSRF